MASVWEGAKKLRRLHAKQGAICPLCRKPLRLKEANLDHIVPRSIGGCGEEWNLRATHIECNSKRGSQPDNSPEYADALNRHKAAGLVNARYWSALTPPPSERR